MAFELIDHPPLSNSDSDQICFHDGSGSGTSQGAKTRQHTLRKRQFRFSSESELAFLREIAVSVSREAQYGYVGSAWDAGYENLRIYGHYVDGKRAKSKAFALINNWRYTSAAEERQSVADVHYNERHALLEDIKERMDDWACKELINFESAAKIRLYSEKKGKELREASMSCLRKGKILRLMNPSQTTKTGCCVRKNPVWRAHSKRLSNL
jgi:hypothetical protein